ncbi:caspase family protein [Labrys monachus]|nr:caspase family protein [Labrys monachus]
MAKLFLVFGALFLLAGAARAQDEKRIALVIGNGAYQAGPLATAANDAGLIAQTLQASGFDVVGARDLDQDALRHAFRDFLDKATASGPHTVAFVYLAGYGLQLQGENYFVPVDARIANAAAVSVDAVRISDFTKALAALPLKMSIVVVDGARANDFARGDQPLAGGLALVDADPNMLVAFNAAPGTVAPAEQGPYGAYAQSLAEMMRVGGLPLQDVFDRTRLRVSEKTNGAVLPWSTSRITEPFVFFERGSGAPAPQASYDRDAAMRAKPIAQFDARDAYMAALDRDTLPGYEEFLKAYPKDAMAKRVRAIVAARREAITWRQTWMRDTPNAYWSYLRRYPRGPHAWDARRRLRHFEAALEPPATFDAIEYDVPPPPEFEVVYVDRPVFIFSDPDFDLPPPPPPPVIFLPPPPRDFVELPPPPPPRGDYMLPMPRYVAVPEWVRPPRYIEPPPQNVIFENIHNSTVVNEMIDNPRREDERPGAAMTPGEKVTGAAIAAGAAAAVLGVTLPPYLRNRPGAGPRNPGGVDRTGGQPILPGQPRPGLQPLPGVVQPGKLPAGQNPPGVNGQNPLPGQAGPQDHKGPAGQNNLPGMNGQKPLPGQGNLPKAGGQPPLPGQAGPQDHKGEKGPGGQNNLPGMNGGQPLPGQAGQQGRKGHKPPPGQNNLPGMNGQAPDTLQNPAAQAQPGAEPGNPKPGKQGRGKKGHGALPGNGPAGGAQPGNPALQPEPGVGGPKANAPGNGQEGGLPTAKQHRRNQPGGDQGPAAGKPFPSQPAPQLERAQPQSNRPAHAPKPQMQPMQERPAPQPRLQPQIRQAPQMQPQRQPRPEPRVQQPMRQPPQAHPAAPGRNCGRPGMPPC